MTDPENLFTPSLRGEAFSRERSVAEGDVAIQFFDFDLQNESGIKETLDCRASLAMTESRPADTSMPSLRGRSPKQSRTL